VAFTDDRFFNIFNFPFIEGNAATALSNPNSLVVTESFAKKYFGGKNALGKLVSFDLVNTKYDLRVTGVIKDLPQNTHFQRQAFVSMEVLNKRFPNMKSWGSFWPRAYVVLKPNTDIKSLEQKITNTFKVYFPQNQQGALYFKLQDLKDIHLYSAGIQDLAVHGDIANVYIVLIIALFILIIACANYINLSTALSFRRRKEVGIKKVIGAGRSQLIKSFIGETFIFVFISTAVAIVLAELFLPYMNDLTGKDLSLNWSNFNLVGRLFLIVILTGIISAYYPALFLSSYNPIRIFKGETYNGNKTISLRKGLIVFQFSLLIGLIICTLVVTKQLDFIENGKLGYDKENILCVPLNGFSYSQIDALKSELSNNPNVVASCTSEPVDDRSLSSTTSFFWKGKEKETNKAITRLHTDHDFASTYKLTLKEGRFFSPEFSASDSNNFVLNETAANLMGKTSTVNKEFKLGNRVGKVIGVVKDFHFSSFHKKIEPLVIVQPDEKQNARLRLLSVRLKRANLKNSIASVEKVWKDIASSTPFNFYFLDQYIDNQYRAEQRTETLLSYFSVFAILIACLGLYGLTLFMTETKTKEIGVRKVLGASVKSIVSLFAKDFIKWILIANI
jgi:putative ABC transport system permease protein